jgi:WS/DGAT/MGAT family acyltransferase
MTERRRVGPVDTMWLTMDRPNNLMVIDAVMWFERPVDWDRLYGVVQQRLVDRYPVFRQRPVPVLAGLAGQCWQDDEDFSLVRHLHRVTLPPPGDEACLRRYVETQMHRPFDRAHPLWEMHLIDGYLGGSAVMTRFHHALADGAALVEVLLSLTDTRAAGDRQPPVGSPPVASARRTGLFAPWAHVSTGLHQLPALARLADADALPEAVTLARQVVHVADKLLLGSNPPTALGGHPEVEKRAVWSAPRPLAEVKNLGRLLGGTINDVMVGAVSGAISTYLVSHDGRATDLTTMVPVNLRPPGVPLPPELGNRFALVLLPLPTGVRRPLPRMAETKRRMDAIKCSPEALITFGLISAIGRTPPRLERELVNFFSGKAIGVTTNVAGPSTPRYLAGTRIAGLLGWVPGSGRQTLGVSIVTYDRTARVGFKADAAVIPDPELLVDAFEAELDELLRLARAA